EIAAERAARAGAAARAVATRQPGVSFTGFAQVDLAMRQSSEDQLDPSGEPLNENRFNLRRARLRVVGDFGIVASATEFDFNTVRGAQARIVDAELTLRVPPESATGLSVVAGTIGLFKIPFGFEVLQSDRDRVFLERSTVVRALFPGEYDLGVGVAG